MNLSSFKRSLLLAAVSVALMGSNLAQDELVLIFPNYASWDPVNGNWLVRVHGWVYESEAGGFFRQRSLAAFADTLGISKEEEQLGYFQDRARIFILDNERGKEIDIAINGSNHTIGISRSDGHVEGEFRLPAAALAVPPGTEKVRNPRLTLAVKEAPEVKRFEGTFQCIGEEGFSVISDIDDTIKVSEVLNRRSLLKNTFLKAFEAVPGMSELYRVWEKQGAVFHYVSASPWQLYPALSQFLQDAQFPWGTMHLKQFRWKDKSFFSLFANSARAKRPALEQILKDFPKRKFILVGDTGEEDPELFASMARDYPGQVVKILLRKSDKDTARPERFVQVFAGLPASVWTAFTEPGEVDRSLP